MPTDWIFDTPALATRGDHFEIIWESSAYHLRQDVDTTLAILRPYAGLEVFRLGATAGSPASVPLLKPTWAALRQVVQWAEVELGAPGWTHEGDYFLPWVRENWSVYFEGETWKVRRTDHGRAYRAGFQRADLARSWVERRLAQHTSRPPRSPKNKVQLTVSGPQKAQAAALAASRGTTVAQLIRDLIEAEGVSGG